MNPRFLVDLVHEARGLHALTITCDKKPRGKVGGSAISVYQALLHPRPPTESQGTSLARVTQSHLRIESGKPAIPNQFLPSRSEG